VTYGRYGVFCKNCGILIGNKLTTCACGKVSIRKLVDGGQDKGLVLYTDDISAIGNFVEIYYTPTGDMLKYFKIGPPSVGKAIFTELEPRIRDFKMYHKKLPCEAVVDIITRYLKGEVQQELADEYQVSKKEIYNIIYRVIKKSCKLPPEISGDNYKELLKERALYRKRRELREG
jgi:predicted DNA-binding protein YlxM (UPF0122 family)